MQISASPVGSAADEPLDMVGFDCIGRELTFNGGTAQEYDVTTLCSDAKEFLIGLQDSGTLDVNGYWKQGFPAHTILREAMEDLEPRLLRITFDDGGTFNAAVYVLGRNWASPVDGVVSATFRFLVTGEIVEFDVVIQLSTGSFSATLDSLALIASGGLSDLINWDDTRIWEDTDIWIDGELILLGWDDSRSWSDLDVWAD
jgi:hypothetical protein